MTDPFKAGTCETSTISTQFNPIQSNQIAHLLIRDILHFRTSAAAIASDNADANEVLLKTVFMYMHRLYQHYMERSVISQVVAISTRFLGPGKEVRCKGRKRIPCNGMVHFDGWAFEDLAAV